MQLGSVAFRAKTSDNNGTTHRCLNNRILSFLPRALAQAWQPQKPHQGHFMASTQLAAWQQPWIQAGSAPYTGGNAESLPQPQKAGFREGCQGWSVQMSFGLRGQGRKATQGRGKHNSWGHHAVPFLPQKPLPPWNTKERHWQPKPRKFSSLWIIGADRSLFLIATKVSEELVAALGYNNIMDT